MEELLNVTKSIGVEVSTPMATTRESANDTKGESASCRSASGDVLVCYVRIVLRFP